MSLTFEDKQAKVAHLSGVLDQSISAVAVDYRGITVTEMTELRKKARDNGVVVEVHRNTLAKRAVEGTAFACLKEALVGPIVLLFSLEEPGAAARLLRDFLKVSKALEVKALVLDGSLLAASQLDAVASLPSREEALAQLLSVMKAPVTKFVRTLKEPVAQVVRVVSAVQKEK